MHSSVYWCARNAGLIRQVIDGHSGLSVILSRYGSASKVGEERSQVLRGLGDLVKVFYTSWEHRGFRQRTSCLWSLYRPWMPYPGGMW
jgi:ribosomal protein S19E (S16A)